MLLVKYVIIFDFCVWHVKISWIKIKSVLEGRKKKNRIKEWFLSLVASASHMMRKDVTIFGQTSSDQGP